MKPIESEGVEIGGQKYAPSCDGMNSAMRRCWEADNVKAQEGCAGSQVKVRSEESTERKG